MIGLGSDKKGRDRHNEIQFVTSTKTAKKSTHFKSINGENILLLHFNHIKALKLEVLKGTFKVHLMHCIRYLPKTFAQLV